MHGVRSRLHQVAESLNADPRITVDYSSFSDPLPGEELARIVNGTGKTLPAGVLDFYGEIGELDLEWQYSDREKIPASGAIHILPIDEVLGDWEDVTWFPGQEERRPLLPFDRFIPEACGAFWELNGGRISESILYHYFPEDLYDTGRSFEEYIELLIKSRGYMHWQKALCREVQDSTEVLEFRENMPRLFSDYDDSLFRPRPETE